MATGFSPPSVNSISPGSAGEKLAQFGGHALISVVEGTVSQGDTKAASSSVDQEPDISAQQAKVALDFIYDGLIPNIATPRTSQKEASSVGEQSDAIDAMQLVAAEVVAEPAVLDFTCAFCCMNC